MSPLHFNISIPTTTTTIPLLKAEMDPHPPPQPFLASPYLRSLIVSQSASTLATTHKNPGGRLRRHSSRPVPLPPRHPEDPPPVLRRLLCKRRLERSLQRRRLSNCRFGPRRRALLRNLRSYKIRPCLQTPVSRAGYSWDSSSRRPHTCSFAR